MTTPNDEQLDLLVGYALGALTPDEVARVSELLEEQPDLRQQLAELQAAASQIPLALTDVEPPPGLRQRTLDHAIGRAPTRPPAPSGGRTAARSRLNLWLYGMGAFNLLGIVLVGFGWWQLLSTRAELTAARVELVRLQQEQQKIVAVASRPDAVSILAGPGGSGSVLRDTDGSAVVAVRLPQLEAGRVYQLWLLRGQSQPISGGTFTVDAQGYGSMTLAPGADLATAEQFAITDEPAPGSPGPTTDILILG
jgi:anti-sigma-K factor RskA